MNKSYLIAYKLIMTSLLVIVLASTCPVIFGAELTWGVFGINYLINWVVTAILVFILPMPKIAMAVTKASGAAPNSPAANILTDTIIGSVIGAFCVLFSVGFATGFGWAGVNFMTRFISSYLQAWPVIIAGVIIFDIVSHIVCRAIFKVDQGSSTGSALPERQ